MHLGSSTAVVSKSVSTLSEPGTTGVRERPNGFQEHRRFAFYYCSYLAVQHFDSPCWARSSRIYPVPVASWPASSALRGDVSQQTRGLSCEVRSNLWPYWVFAARGGLDTPCPEDRKEFVGCRSPIHESSIGYVKVTVAAESEVSMATGSAVCTEAACIKRIPDVTDRDPFSIWDCYPGSTGTVDISGVHRLSGQGRPGEHISRVVKLMHCQHFGRQTGRTRGELTLNSRKHDSGHQADKADWEQGQADCCTADSSGAETHGQQARYNEDKGAIAPQDHVLPARVIVPRPARLGHVQQASRAVGYMLLAGAFGGTRTPNLLIRRSWARRPGSSVTSRGLGRYSRVVYVRRVPSSGLATVVAHLAGRRGGIMGGVSELIVVSGPPGAGKTTAARTLSQLFDPSALIPGDQFFAFIERGSIAPWTSPAHHQNEIVTEAAGAAAGRLAAGGYTVVYDGVIGPWFLETFVAATRIPFLHYAVLLPPEPVCLERVRSRAGHGFKDQEATRQMYQQFAGADIDARYVVASTGDPVTLASHLFHLVHDGRLRWPDDGSRTRT